MVWHHGTPWAKDILDSGGFDVERLQDNALFGPGVYMSTHTEPTAGVLHITPDIRDPKAWEAAQKRYDSLRDAVTESQNQFNYATELEHEGSMDFPRQVAYLPRRFLGEQPQVAPSRRMQDYDTSVYKTGGAYFDAKTKQDITGQTFQKGMISVEKGIPEMRFTGVMAEGITGKGSQHYYTLKTESDQPVSLLTYQDKSSEPRGRPTTRGDTELGEQIGEIRTSRGNTHPVYDTIRVVPKKTQKTSFLPTEKSAAYRVKEAHQKLAQTKTELREDPQARAYNIREKTKGAPTVRAEPGAEGYTGIARLIRDSRSGGVVSEVVDQIQKMGMTPGVFRMQANFTKVLDVDQNVNQVGFLENLLKEYYKAVPKGKDFIFRRADKTVTMDKYAIETAFEDTVKEVKGNYADVDVDFSLGGPGFKPKVLIEEAASVGEILRKLGRNLDLSHLENSSSWITFLWPRAIVNDFLQHIGYDGLTHRGGLITGTTKHRTAIALRNELAENNAKLSSYYGERVRMSSVEEKIHDLADYNVRTFTDHISQNENVKLFSILDSVVDKIEVLGTTKSQRIISQRVAKALRDAARDSVRLTGRFVESYFHFKRNHKLALWEDKLLQQYRVYRDANPNSIPPHIQRLYEDNPNIQATSEWMDKHYTHSRMLQKKDKMQVMGKDGNMRNAGSRENYHPLILSQGVRRGINARASL